MIQVNGIAVLVMRINGALWAWEDDACVFFRLPPNSVPDAALRATDATDVEVVRSFASATTVGPALPVQRGIVPKIHGVPFPNADLLAAIEQQHGEITWHAAGRWHAARSAAGEVVAAMLLPKGQEAVAILPLLVQGAGWLCAPTFGFRFRGPPEALAQVVATATANATQGQSKIAQITGLLERAATAAEVTMTRDPDGEVAHLGASRVPLAHALIVTSAWPIDTITWRWLGAHEPVVAFHAGEPVGYVMPLVRESSGGGEA